MSEKQNQLAKAQEGQETRLIKFTGSQMALMKALIFTEAKDEIEVKGLIAACEAIGLNPLIKEVFVISTGYGEKRQLTLQPSIDGRRKLAERTGLYEGPGETYFKGAPDEPWTNKDSWDMKRIPWACKVEVYRAGWRKPASYVAHWSDYAQRNTKTGEILGRWKTNPSFQLAIAAERQVLRQTFPNYIPVLPPEMAQMVRFDTEDVPEYDATNTDQQEPLAMKVWSDDNCKSIIDKIGMMPEQLEVFLGKAKVKSVGEALRLLELEHERMFPDGEGDIVDAHFVESPAGHPDLDEDTPAGEPELFGGQQ